MSELYGIGAVEFDSEESAAAALSEMNGKKVGNQTLKVSYYQKQAKFTPPAYFPASFGAQSQSGNPESGTDFRILFIKGMNKQVSNAPF